MNQSIYIMFEDIPVLEVNLDTALFKILDAVHLPFKFKNSLLPVIDFAEVKSHYDDIQRQRTISNNKDVLISWLSSRTLILSQRYAKKLFQAYRLPQHDDKYSRAKLSLTCKSLSIQDNYWVKSVGSNVQWKDLNLRHNSLNNAISQIQLHGKSLTLNSKPDSLAFSTNGAYAKAWHRDDDDTLWLYKAGDGNSEERIEVMCSNILDRCNVSHCHYESRIDDGLNVCACPSMTSDDISIIDGDNFISYCYHHNLDPDKELKQLDPDGYWKMMIVDYLLANPDRHTQNWGLYYNSKTMELLGLHPLFDHNNAFDIDVMQNEEFGSHFLNKTLKENALYAMRQTDFHFTAPITRDLFITDRQYDTFMKRSKQLGIQERIKTIDDLYIQYGGFNKYKTSVIELIPNSVKDDLEHVTPSLVEALKCVQKTHNCYRI